MTTTDQPPETAPETTSEDRSPAPLKTTVQRIASPGNVAAAVFGLGASIACAVLLPLSAYKALTGLAFIVAVVAIGAIVYRRYFKAETPAVEEAPDGR